MLNGECEFSIVLMARLFRVRVLVNRLLFLNRLCRVQVAEIRALPSSVRFLPVVRASGVRLVIPNVLAVLSYLFPQWVPFLFSRISDTRVRGVRLLDVLIEFPSGTRGQILVPTRVTKVLTIIW